MDSLSEKRHTLAHLLASAIAQKYPHAKPTIGPAIDTGFYYDFDFGTGDKPGDDDLQKLGNIMKNLLPKWTEFSHKIVTPEDARAHFANNPFKLELIEDIIAKGEAITLYTCGGFTDLCRGGHSEHPATEIDRDSFELEKIAGAYWRGDSEKSMLTRIYGLAFETKADLAAHHAQIEEAKKRDHRKLGKELDLFTFSELVGAGLPLWTPKGTAIRHQLDTFIWQLREKHGYQRVTIPHLTKKDLYVTSGHWEKFADELFRITTREGKEYALKPMNCPHHTQIFDRIPHSYRDMPQRYAETTMVYRDEQSGELGGLTRVLSITQDDAHVFCRQSQVKEEFDRVWDIISTFYGTFGFQDMRVRLSLHDPSKMEKYLGTEEIWEKAENALREIAKAHNSNYFEAEGEAAMYGPKLDFMAKDSLGREHQVATIQLDMNLPERFDLTCTNERGEKERIVMIHCAIMGSIERFTAVLVEHLAGNFPLWLSPVQTRVITVGEDQTEYAKGVHQALHDAGIRAEFDTSNESLGKKIRGAKQEKLPYFIVIGAKEVESQTVTLESRGGGSEPLSLGDLVTRLSDEIKTKKM